MNTLPRAIGIRPFGKLGFYDLLRIRKCILHGAANNLSISEPLPEIEPGESALVGRFFHSAMEAACHTQGAEELDERIERLLEKLQSEVDATEKKTNRGSVSSWRAVNAAVIAARSWHQTWKNVSERAVTFSEVTIESKRTPFVGRPDFFSIVKGICTLIEFKINDGGPRAFLSAKERDEQCAFYAALLYELPDVHEVNASIVSLEGRTPLALISRDDAAKFQESANREVVNANRAIVQSEDLSALAHVDVVVCSGCNKRIVCKSFLNAQEELATSDAIFVVSGQVISVSSLTKSHSVVRISSAKFGMAPQEVELEGSLARALCRGQSVSISELRRRGSRFISSRKSLVYSAE